MRWAYELNDFSFDIIHKSGKEQIQSVHSFVVNKISLVTLTMTELQIDITNFWNETLRVQRWLQKQHGFVMEMQI